MIGMTFRSLPSPPMVGTGAGGGVGPPSAGDAITVAYDVSPSKSVACWVASRFGWPPSPGSQPSWDCCATR